MLIIKMVDVKLTLVFGQGESPSKLLGRANHFDLMQLLLIQIIFFLFSDLQRFFKTINPGSAACLCGGWFSPDKDKLWISGGFSSTVNIFFEKIYLGGDKKIASAFFLAMMLKCLDRER